jgi:excisionase family DNA binding protein
MDLGEKLLSIAEAAKFLNVHEKTIRRWLKNGEIEGLRFGRLWRIKESTILGKQRTPNSYLTWRKAS